MKNQFEVAARQLASACENVAFDQFVQITFDAR
jgi:hypothetical protein